MKSKDQILEEVSQIFRNALEEPNLALEYSSSPDTIEKWNSISNLLLINAIEEAYKISLPIDVIFGLNTVGDICDYLYSIESSN